MKYFVEKHFSHYHHYQALVISLEKNINKHAEIKTFWKTIWQNLEKERCKKLNKSIEDTRLNCFSFIYALSHGVLLKDIKQNQPK